MQTVQGAFHPKAIFKETYCAFNALGCMLISEALICTSNNMLHRVPHLLKRRFRDMFV